jgi:hypothetical protein
MEGHPKRLLRGRAIEVGPEEGEKVIPRDGRLLRGDVVEERTTLASRHVERASLGTVQAKLWLSEKLNREH